MRNNGVENYKHESIEDISSLRHKILAKFFFFLHRCLRGFGNRLLDERLVNPRKFSNATLRFYAPIFEGRVINVSGWDDRDKEGGCYRNYFKNCSSYTVSNASGRAKGFGSMKKDGAEEIELDLENPLPSDLKRKFDVVFNHTTLEHVFNIEQAFENLCELSKDVVVLVIPVLQEIHVLETYGDYWRPTTLGVAKMFKKYGFEPLVIQVNDQPFAPVYCFVIAVRNPEKYRNKIKRNLDFEMGKFLYGSGIKGQDLEKLI